MKYRETETENIWNLVSYRQMREPLSSAEQFKRSMVLYGDNRKAFADLYGKRHQTFTSEFRYDVWRVEFRGAHFWLLTAGGKGTGIELERPGDLSVVPDFIEHLYSELLKREPWASHDWSFMEKP